MDVLVIVNDSAYGSERPYNAIRLAEELARTDGVGVRVFLIGDAVTCALAGQRAPDGHYHLDRMLTSVRRHGGEIGCCATCLDARGIRDDMLVEAAHRSSLGELADWTVAADRTLVF